MITEDIMNETLTKMIWDMLKGSELSKDENNSIRIKNGDNIIYIWKGHFSTNFSILGNRDITYIINDSFELFQKVNHLLNKNNDSDDLDKKILSKLEEVSSLSKDIYNLRLKKAILKENKDKYDYAIISDFIENNKPEDYNNE